MNANTRALRDAVNENIDMDRLQEGADNYRSKFLAQLKSIAGDAERLLTQAAETSSDGFAAARSQFDRQLRRTQNQLDQATRAVNRNAQRSASAARGYVRENPLSSVGVATAAGVIVGLLVVSILRNRR